MLPMKAPKAGRLDAVTWVTVKPLITTLRISHGSKVQVSKTTPNATG